MDSLRTKSCRIMVVNRRGPWSGSVGERRERKISAGAWPGGEWRRDFSALRCASRPWAALGIERAAAVATAHPVTRTHLGPQWARDGFVVLEGFLAPQEVEALRAEGQAFTQQLPPAGQRAVFSTTSVQQNKDRYFLDSADKVSVFFEADALDPEGNLKVDAENSLNKVGHNLHQLNHTFQKTTFSNKVREVCWQLGLKRPAVVQSMYIYKNPGIGSEVTPHQDATFLHVDTPNGNANTVIGFWLALDDATVDNGCLQFISGSHCTGVHRRLVRNTNTETGELITFSGPPPSYPKSAFHCVPVPKGTCILIHGQVVHQSAPNRSTQPRHVYTFHVADLARGTWSPENWLQLPENVSFPVLYDQSNQ